VANLVVAVEVMSLNGDDVLFGAVPEFAKGRKNLKIRVTPCFMKQAESWLKMCAGSKINIDC
jgi:hypothetical protein